MLFMVKQKKLKSDKQLRTNTVWNEGLQWDILHNNVCKKTLTRGNLGEHNLSTIRRSTINLLNHTHLGHPPPVIQIQRRHKPRPNVLNGKEREFRNPPSPKELARDAWTGSVPRETMSTIWRRVQEHVRAKTGTKDGQCGVVAWWRVGPQCHGRCGWWGVGPEGRVCRGVCTTYT